MNPRPTTGHYVVTLAPNGITKLKQYVRVKRAPPKATPASPIPLVESDYDYVPIVIEICQECNKPKPATQLLLCDAVLLFNTQQRTCDRMVCLQCAGYESVPEGNFYCNNKHE